MKIKMCIRTKIILVLPNLNFTSHTVFLNDLQFLIFALFNLHDSVAIFSLDCHII
jgi:hypothetical protein